MTKAIIIEDEKNASDLLKNTLTRIDKNICIEAILSSIDESIHYLSGNKSIDIIFCDVQLTDGLSFAIFQSVKINVPIVFITGYDHFMMNAFENNGIDYLLKPIDEEDVLKALNKYKSLQKHFGAAPQRESMQQFLQQFNGHKKTRIIAKKGIENIALLMTDIVLFYTEHKVVFAVDKNSKRYLIDKNLTDLEYDLDQRIFFRANRQYIINVDYIKSFKPYERVKLWVELSVNNLTHTIIVSQETAPLFKNWLLNA